MRRVGLIFMAIVLIFSLTGNASADFLWGAGSSNWGVAPAVIFQLDTSTGTVTKKFVYNDWSWIMGVAYAPGGRLYALHNRTSDPYNFKLAKIDASNGFVLSDTLVKNLTQTDWPQLNTLYYYVGKLYGIENCTWGGTSANAHRGYVYEIPLDASGDPGLATLGAYVGPAPDGALTFRGGIWYASDWRWVSGNHSAIKATTDIMNINFSQLAVTSGAGLFAGWDFERDGDFIGVCWDTGFKVYKISLPTGVAQQIFDIGSQLTEIIMLGGMSYYTAAFYSCASFEPPCASGPIKVKKNRVIPLKAQLLNGSGLPVTNADISSPPVVQVIYKFGTTDADDVTSDALSAGLGTEGNQFVFRDGEWQFNLQTKNYTAKGSYTVKMVSGDESEYIILPECTVIFVVE